MTAALQDEEWVAAQLLRITEATVEFRGARYFQALVVALTRVLKLRFAMVVMRGEGRDAQVLALADGEDMRQPYRYNTETLPCRTVIDGEPVAVFCNIVEFFPGAADLEAYVGHPLRGQDGQVIGLLAVMHHKPLAQTTGLPRLIRALAGRTAAELECENPR